MPRKARETETTETTSLEVTIDYQRGSCAVWYDPHDIFLEEESVVMFSAPGQVWKTRRETETDELGRPRVTTVYEKDEYGRNVPEPVSLTNLRGTVRYWPPAGLHGIYCGDVPEWELLHGQKVTLENIRPYLGN